MKKLIGALLLLVIGFVFSTASVSAHEGTVDLTSSSVSCKGVSIFQEGNYRVSGRCDGLVYPYETLYNKYVLWGKTTVRGEMVRIAEIDRGYFSGYVSSAFDSMYVTAEKDGLVRKASDKQVVSGRVTPFNFDKSQTTTSTTATTATASTAPATAKTSATTSSTAGAVVGKIVTSLLVVILVIVGLAIGASLLFRSRGSVSTH